MEASDPIAAALSEKFEPDDFATLKQASADLAPVVGRLSEAELDALADRVAERVIKAKAADASPEKRAALQRLIKSIAFQIGLNLAASALWQLLAYLGHVWVFADSGDAAAAQHKASEAAERRKLASHVNSAQRARFQELLDGAGGALANALIAQSMWRSAEAALGASEATAPTPSSNELASAITQQLFAELKGAAARSFED